jgi:hypothetical protein
LPPRETINLFVRVGGRTLPTGGSAPPQREEGKMRRTLSVGAAVALAVALLLIPAGAIAEESGIPGANGTFGSISGLSPFDLFPTITCPANMTVPNDSNQAGAVVNYPAFVVSGGDPPVTAIGSPASGSFFPVGTTTVTGAATDVDNDQVTCTFTITVNDTQPPSITCPANITVDATSPSGAVVTFTATASDNVPGVTVLSNPPSGHVFPVGTTTVTSTATDTAANTATCSFTVTVNNPTLTVARAGTGSGTVTSNPPGINCPPDCIEHVPVGTHFTLTATPADGSVFVNWSGGGCPATGTCGVTVDNDTTVSARFDLAAPPVTFDLHVSKVGKGRVFSAPEGINCGRSCTAAYVEGSMITLTAKPRRGWMLERWRYDCSGSKLICRRLEMSSNRRAKAVFVRMAARILGKDGRPAH